MKLCVYEIATGKVRWTVDVPDSMAAAQTDPHDDLDQVAVSDTVNGQTHYILDGAVTPRPILPGFGKLTIVADDTDEAKLVLGAAFQATIDGQVFQVSDPDEDGDFVLALTSPMPAVYRVRVDHWPFLDYEAEVTAQ